jgi:cupin fold WbuC family metalloprotein
MTPRVFDGAYLARLIEAAARSPRGRQHDNVHRDYGESCQRLFNAICEASYIRPHRHLEAGKTETLVAARGLFALHCFDDSGAVISVTRFGTDAHAEAAGVEVPSGLWHTVVALSPGAILFETKSGPFDPLQAKEVAPWAPAEGDERAQAYLGKLKAHALAG